MCGIAGIIKLDSSTVLKEDLVKFTDSIIHRGPDGSGYELLEDNQIGLGHRRLSILDLSEAGKQPMYNASKELCISFNGEVYNFIEIKGELEKEGFIFRTKTDTEVVLAAYTRWGIDCFRKFNGMFVIAVWDIKKKELIIVRDRFGIKPIYYLFVPHKIFAFCSETIGFKNLNGFKRDIEEQHLNLALYDPALIEGSDKTIFKNIYQLAGGTFLTLKLNSDLIVKRWWNTKDELRKVPSNYNDQVDEFRELFENACKLRLRSDVPIASALSGGLDSSSVYATLHKITKNNTLDRLPNDWQKAFVATFPNTKVDEKHFAKNVVDYVGGVAEYIVPDYSKLADEVIEAGKLFDGIIYTPINAISDVYKSMRKNGITVSMDGHGVDEMMYGYNTYVHKAFYDALIQRDFDFANDLSKTLCGLANGYDLQSFTTLINSIKNKGIVKQILSRVKNKLSNRKSCSNKSYSRNWLAIPNKDLVNSILEKEITFGHQSQAENLLFQDFHYLDLPINLRDFDRASMQHGIEIRMPFMDYRLVSYVFSLPPKSKIGNGFTKRILRDAMKKTLPEEIRTRTLKIGISGPDEWYTNELKPLILDIFSSKDFMESKYWDGRSIKHRLEVGYKNNSFTKKEFNLIWGMVSFSLLNNND